MKLLSQIFLVTSKIVSEDNSPPKRGLENLSSEEGLGGFIFMQTLVYEASA
jgi:hypothetical protein